MATGYVLDGRSSIPGRGKKFSVLHSEQSESEAHPSSITMGTGDSFSGGVMLTTPLHLMPRSRMTELYF
jgi:hypothetical protein